MFSNHMENASNVISLFDINEFFRNRKILTLLDAL
jgi:hypothetical protein